MFVRAYLRASTAEQDATRARAALDAFAASHGFRIASRYVEHESGTRLARPELFRLLDDCGPGDVLLVEQVDRPMGAICERRSRHARFGSCLSICQPPGT